MLEAGLFDLPVKHKFSAQGTKLSIWTSRLQLQDCQSTVRQCPRLRRGEVDGAPPIFEVAQMVRCLEGLFCPPKILQLENCTSFYNYILSFLLGAWQALRSWKVVAKQPRGNGYWLVPVCLSTFVFSLIYLATGNENLEREEQVS